jgi:predicted transcriptional regulator
MKNRSRNEIITSILGVISGGPTSRTKLMYGSFVSFAQLNDYLAFLFENNLISYKSQQQQKKNKSKRRTFSQFYTITQKGAHFLNIHNQMNEMITNVQTK